MTSTNRSDCNELAQRFDAWWYDEGSGMPPSPDEEACEHVKRVSRIAWMNGADVAEHSGPPTVKRLPDGAQVIEPASHTLLVPALKPIPVSERKPGPDDCDERGRCWCWDPAADPGIADGVPSWELSRWEMSHTHWLPINAMLIPARMD